MQKKPSTYHVLLRVTALTFAFLLLFDSGLFSSTTRELSKNTQLYVASVVGIQASVKATELNTYTAQLTQRDQALDARELALQEREIAIGLNQSTATSADYSTYILSIILFILVVLIVLNYALDFTRRPQVLVRKVRQEPSHEAAA